MQLSFLIPLLSFLCLVSAAPAKRGVRVIKVTQTVDNTVTNTDVVNAPVQTSTGYSTSTVTVTTTHYTSTYTATVMGKQYTYTSVFESAVTLSPKPATSQAAIVESQPQQEPQESQKAQNPPAAQSSAQVVITSTLEPTTSAAAPSPAATSSSVPTSSAAATSSLEPTSSPSVPSVTSSIYDEVSTLPTDAPATASSVLSGSWFLEDVSTKITSGVCYVDYDYYLTDYTETVTSTSTVYSTITV
ncbi:putative filamentous growth regulator [Clavispora lusitaniae]|uniref:Filamentous growth regulator n=1 Tax=Clavispora lusitaniae TaxID=36911 RepID=A0AA91T1E6_CLALS|nr:putative filamentous growth regulator [Clavispora lusitaniae]